jgi:hypothetical protein
MDNNDYIDTVVLTDRPDSCESAPYDDVAGRRNISVVNDARLTRVGQIEISSLTIDESMDGGGDPYNSTGKHCVLKIKE